MESTLNNKTVGMESLTELYRIGFGPSSSHTMGPELAVSLFSQKNPTADRFVNKCQKSFRVNAMN